MESTLSYSDGCAEKEREECQPYLDRIRRSADGSTKPRCGIPISAI